MFIIQKKDLSAKTYAERSQIMFYVQGASAVCLTRVHANFYVGR